MASYARHHFDYEATAYFDVRIRQFGSRRLVFVFMYTDRLGDPGPIAGILGSIKLGTVRPVGRPLITNTTTQGRWADMGEWLN